MIAERSNRARHRMLVAGLWAVVLLGLLCWLYVSKSAQPVPAVDLLVDSGAFPAGWSASSGPTSFASNVAILAEQGATDCAGISVRPPGVSDPQPWEMASQYVWSFGTDFQAYLELLSARFRPPNRITREPVLSPEYHSQTASSFRLVCGALQSSEGEGNFAGGRAVCYAVGQYGHYVSEFTAPLGGASGLSPEEFGAVLAAIDHQMSKRFSGALH
jgi:hypothetical protein